MTRTTQQVREAWSPACQTKGADLVAAYQALDAVMKKHGYKPRSGVTGAFNCRKITGGTGYSLHAYGPGVIFTFWTGVRVTTAVAVDVNWDKNPYGPRLITDMPRAMVDDICAIKTVDGLQVWRWGGYYSNNKDAMHYEIVVSPAELRKGIAGFPGAEEDWFDMATKAELEEVVTEALNTNGRFQIEVTKDGAKKKVGIDTVVLEIAQKVGVIGPDPAREWIGA